MIDDRFGSVSDAARKIGKRRSHADHTLSLLPLFPSRRVYPGKGRRFVTKSGQLVVLAGSKVRGLREGGKKPAKLVWTQAWRRMHKKLNVETSSRRRVKKIVKASVSRAYVGMDAAAVRDYYWASSMRVRPACRSA